MKMNEREVVTKNIRIDAQTRSRLGACIFLAATSTIRAWQERISAPFRPSSLSRVAIQDVYDAPCVPGALGDAWEPPGVLFEGDGAACDEAQRAG